jgi:hypothetical protein
MKHLIIDDFLPIEHFEELKRNVLGSNTVYDTGTLPLFYAGGSVQAAEVHQWDHIYKRFNLDYSNPCPHLSHVFFQNNEGTSPNYKQIIIPILEVIRPVAVERVKLNINLSTAKNTASGWHVDTEDRRLTTALLFLTSHEEGGTLLETGELIKPIENRLVQFPSYIAHTGIISTSIDEKVRAVINFNYLAQ